MDKFVIDGGHPLHGKVKISGAKNSTLPMLAACLLTEEPCIIHNVPHLDDVDFMLEILQSLGASVERQGTTVRIQSAKITPFGDYNLIRKMRGSICILGPLVGRLGEATVSMPGGCVIGTRPIDLHLKGLRALGTRIEVESGYVHAKAIKLRGNEIFLGGRSGPTVLGTINVMMAACLAEGRTVIDCAACEPEVVDVARFLEAMGARIEGIGSPSLIIHGVDRLGGAEYSVIPDRIEAATFALAAAVTDGEVFMEDADLQHLSAVADKMQEAGCELVRSENGFLARRGKLLQSVDITTQPHPGFPTDAQAQMMVFMTLIPGISIITERIFESRFMHVNELIRLGADISIEGPSAIVKGGKKLSGAPVMASDLRASAALVLAGLAARGRTEVSRVYHIDRGYEKIDAKLEALGGRIERVSV
jgi:UDP-N-acetylglucosamine 1-carboxyvinyltransferase